jgi:hypothetical protein
VYTSNERIESAVLAPTGGEEGVWKGALVPQLLYM